LSRELILKVTSNIVLKVLRLALFKFKFIIFKAIKVKELKRANIILESPACGDYY
jgi:hypothetical protein